MDYVEWVEQVWQAISIWWRAAAPHEQLGGFTLLDLASLLDVEADLFSPDQDKERAARAINDALKDLKALGIIQVEADVTYATHIVDPQCEAQLGAKLTGLWPMFVKVPLTDRQHALLTALIEVAIDVRGAAAEVLVASDQELYEHLGWDWDETDAFALIRSLLALRPALAETYSHTFGAWQIMPTYGGVVRVTRQLATEWDQRMAQLVEEGETLQTDFKQELVLKTERQKGEFVKDVLALANTRVRGERFLLIGITDGTGHLRMDWEDPHITQDTIENILGEYTYPMPQVRYQKVPYGGGAVGVLEVYRNPADLPYRPKRTIGKTAQGKIYVRHGSHSVPIEDEDPEAQDLIAEGVRARQNM